jgi:hypothetical protein
MNITSKYVVTVSPLGFNYSEGSYSMFSKSGSWLAANNAVSKGRDDGSIPEGASVKIIEVKN